MQGNIKKLLLIFCISAVIGFKIFTELYVGNYCAPRWGYVVVWSNEEIEKMKHCSDSFICKIGNVEHSSLPPEEDWKPPIQVKNFSCDRRF